MLIGSQDKKLWGQCNKRYYNTDVMFELFIMEYNKEKWGIIICGSSHQISEIGQYSSEEKTKEVFYQIIQEIKLGTKVFEMPNDD
jgi:hypothetical protein